MASPQLPADPQAPAPAPDPVEPCAGRTVKHDGRFWRAHCPVHGFIGYASRFVDADALTCVEGGE